LQAALDDAFGGTPAELRVVARQATDLAASGKPETDRGGRLTVGAVVTHLRDAPDGSSLAERWNWWMGALEMAYGGYRQFQVRVVDDDERRPDPDEDAFR
jgi:hypothetical protein